MSELLKILVTNAGDCATANFVRSLRLADRDRYRIIGVETNELMAPHSEADETWLLPDPERDEAAYLEQLRQIVLNERVDLVYGGDTGPDLTLISKYRERIGTRVFLPAKADFDLYEDKWDTYLALRNLYGVRVPWTKLIAAPDDLDEVFSRFDTVWLRNRVGSGGKGAISTRDIEFARQWIARHEGWGQFCAAQCLTKTSSTWSGLWRSGRLVACQARKRLFWAYGHTSPTGITGITGAQQTINDASLHDMSMAAILGSSDSPEGIISVDFTYDREGLPHITEIQSGRFYTSIYFLARAGLNFPEIYVDLALDRAITLEEHQRINPLGDQLVWLKQVEREPILTTIGELPGFYKRVNVASDSQVAACTSPC